jgi:hypothetical protein
VNFDNLYISISILVLLVLPLVIGMVCLYKYKQLKNFLCCNLHWGRQEPTSQTNGEETVRRRSQQENGGSTHEMTPFSPDSDHDSSKKPTEV